MKNIRFALLILIFFFVSANAITPYYPNEYGVTINLSLNKSKYLLDEIVWYELTVIIENGIKLDYFPYLKDGADLKFKVTTEKNKEMGYHGIDPSFIRGSDYIFPDTLFSVGRLEYGFLEEDFYKTHFYYYYYPVDEYKVYADLLIIINNKEYTIRSNEVKFSVSNPENRDRESYEEYKIIKNIYKQKVDSKSIVETVNKYIENYKESVYCENLLLLNDIYYQMEYGEEKYVNYCKNMITNYPNYYCLYYYSFLYNYYNKQKNMEMFDSFLSELIKDTNSEVQNKLIRMHQIPGKCKIIINRSH